MKRIYSILLAGVALVAVASCGNRGKKTEAVEDVVEEPAEVRVYSNAYDGYTNVRQKPTSKSKLVGTIRQGNEYVVATGVEDNWIQVDYYGQTGYVHKDHVGDTPCKPVTVNVDANWLSGCWTAGNDIHYCIYSNGRYTTEYIYDETIMRIHGKWHLEGNEIVLTAVYVHKYSGAYYSKSGDAEIFTINKSTATIGGMKKYALPRQNEVLECEYDGITKESFNFLKKEANKYVKISNEAGDRLIARIQELENEQLDYDGGSSDNDDDNDDRTKKRGKSEDWDEVLTSYEEYVDKYVSLVKKAAKGDAVALASYPSLMKKAEDLADKLDNAEDDMSSAQLARYKKITKKLMKAAEELDD